MDHWLLQMQSPTDVLKISYPKKILRKSFVMVSLLVSLQANNFSVEHLPVELYCENI